MQMFNFHCFEGGYIEELCSSSCDVSKMKEVVDSGFAEGAGASILSLTRDRHDFAIMAGPIVNTHHEAFPKKRHKLPLLGTLF